MPETLRRMQQPAFIRQVPPSRLAHAAGRSGAGLALLALLILIPCGHAAERMKAANSPALLVKAAQEFNVPADIEGQRCGIVNYCGIPDPDLARRRALDVCEFMSQACRRFDIEWHARRVNLAPIRAEVRAIVAAERHKDAEASATGEAGEAVTGLAPDAGNAATSTPANPASAARRGWALLWFVVALLVLLLFVCGALLLRRRYGGDTP